MRYIVCVSCGYREEWKENNNHIQSTCPNCEEENCFEIIYDNTKIHTNNSKSR